MALPGLRSPHKTNAPTLKLSDSEYAWMSTDQLKEAVKDNKLADGADIIKWLHMWQNEEDEDGQPVTRSFGVPSTHVAYFKYNGNGNPEGTYLVGEFDENGLPMPADLKPQSIRQRTLYSLDSNAILAWNWY